ncbi:hypothetical protein E2562_035477 [Oryza meyeriana var. granulata]|uniref:Uncharacterized protein n=1 Tax=Oryza meyeriana var. granulata TaxID=110450 RepID=A0A6G1CKZ3_9ORYZ|nr:hypothetical protein E2562_035477 [Oryza meyeriana var. granulata]
MDDGVVRDVNRAPVSGHFFVADVVSEGEQAAVVENECEAGNEIAFVQSESDRDGNDEAMQESESVWYVLDSLACRVGEDARGG